MVTYLTGLLLRGQQKCKALAGVKALMARVIQLSHGFLYPRDRAATRAMVTSSHACCMPGWSLCTSYHRLSPHPPATPAPALQLRGTEAPRV